MRRQTEKKHKTYFLTIMIIITIIVLTSLVFILTIGAKDVEKQNKEESLEKKVVQSTSKSNNFSSKYRISSKTKDNSSYISETVEITDLTPYLNLSGKYDANNGRSCSIDFNQETFILYYAVGREQKYSFTKVLLHADETLVINAEGYYDQFEQNGEYKSVKTEISVLLAPEGTFLRRNWQTGDEINDVTDKDVSRIAIANSNDHGITYNMTPSYRAFETNGYDSDKNQHSAIYIKNND